MTPLMLSIMSLAFQRAGADELAGQKGDSTDERRKRVFHRYVEEMFQHKETVSAVFQKEKTINWLSWLARKTREHSRSVFLVEGLQPSWLGKTSEWVAYITVVCLSLVPIVGLMSWLIYEFDQIRWVFVTLLWLTFVQINPPRDITLVEAIRWNWSKFRGWAIFFPIACLLDLIIGRFRGLLSGHFRDEWSWFLFSIMAVGSLLNGLTYTVHEEKVFPNQGIKLSRNISLAVSLVCLLVLTLGALFSKLFYQKMLAVLMSGL